MEINVIIPVISAVIAFFSLLISLPQVRRLLDKKRDKDILYKSNLKFKSEDYLFRVKVGNTMYENGAILAVISINFYIDTTKINLTFPESIGASQEYKIKVGDNFEYSYNNKKFIIIIMKLNDYEYFFGKKSILVLNKEI